MRKAALLALFGAFAAAACGGGPKDAEEALKDKGVLDVLQDAADDEYDPPADGKLTEKQMDMYIKVKERERDLLKVAREDFKEQAAKAKQADEKGSSLTAAWEGLKALRSAGDLVTLDIRAAQELNFNTAEYQWVKGQVLAAAISDYTEQVRSSAAQSWEESLQKLKESRDKATDENLRQALDGQIKSLEQIIADQKASQTETAEDQPGLDYNRQLLAKYQDRIKVLDTEIEKFKDLN